MLLGMFTSVSVLSCVELKISSCGVVKSYLDRPEDVFPVSSLKRIAFSSGTLCMGFHFERNVIRYWSILEESLNVKCVFLPPEFHFTIYWSIGSPKSRLETKLF